MSRRMVQWSTCSSKTAVDVVATLSLQTGQVRWSDDDVKENDEGGSGEERLSEEMEKEEDPRRRIMLGVREGERELDRDRGDDGESS